MGCTISWWSSSGLNVQQKLLMFLLNFLSLSFLSAWSFVSSEWILTIVSLEVFLSTELKMSMSIL
jgi:hypothetical protein